MRDWEIDAGSTPVRGEPAVPYGSDAHHGLVVGWSRRWLGLPEALSCFRRRNRFRGSLRPFSQIGIVPRNLRFDSRFRMRIPPFAIVLVAGPAKLIAI